MEDEGTYGEGRDAASIIYGVVERGGGIKGPRDCCACSVERLEGSEIRFGSKDFIKFHNGPNRMIAGAVPNQQVVQKPRCIRWRVKTNAGGTGNTDWGRLSGHLSVAFSNVHVHTCALVVDFTWYGLLPVPGVRQSTDKDLSTLPAGSIALGIERNPGGAWAAVAPFASGFFFSKGWLGVGQAGRGAGQEMAGDRYKEAKEVSVGRQGPIKRIASTIMEEGDFGDWALKDLEPERD
ncbi:hypothetical protein EDB86DRAFT_2828938 [Lactarius hatsudake]|nr:hypothetical protein EDB86DRAFT_2828938 [Lactarius hatsudake]